MNHRWGNVEEKRDKQPEVRVSFHRDNEVAIQMIARWFGLSVKEFKKLIPRRRNGG